LSLPLTTRFGADPLLDLEVANKRYVDNRAGLLFAKVVKTIDETINDSDVLQDDDELFFTPQINTVYRILLYIYLSSGGAPDWKQAISVPAGAAGLWHTSLVNWRMSQMVTVDSTIGQAIALSNSAPTGSLMVARVIMGATAGDINYQWAQNTQTASDTICLRGSTMLVYEEGSE